MRLKEEEGLEGSEHLPRATVKQVRNKIRRERARYKKKSQKALHRRMTSMEMTGTSSGIGGLTGLRSLPGVMSPQRSSSVAKDAEAGNYATENRRISGIIQNSRNAGRAAGAEQSTVPSQQRLSI